MRARGPYPFAGDLRRAGSAKTVVSKMLKALIDPSAAPVRALPRDQSKFPIGAQGSAAI
jgi:putative DNA primase/helicase